MSSSSAPLQPKTEPVVSGNPTGGPTVVEVTGLAKTTTKEKLDEFFSFCGEIKEIDLKPDGDHQKAEIKFVKESAASTAEMLNGGALEGETLRVKSLSSQSATAQPHVASEGDKVGQEEKPRSAIVAEYLAHGYKLSDDVVQRAIDLDAKYGLSHRFTAYLRSIDRTLGEKLARHDTTTAAKPSGAAAAATTTEKDASKAAAPSGPAGEGPTTTTQVPGGADTAQQPSLARQVQERANTFLESPQVKSKADFLWARGNEYYNKAAHHPRISELYSKMSKTVMDIHEEARRIADEKKTSAAAKTT